MKDQIDNTHLEDLVRSLGVVVGERVHEYRTALGLTVADLAELAGLSKAMLSKIENSRTSPSLSTLARLSQALNVPITAFFRGLDEDHEAILVKAGQGLDIGADRARNGVSYSWLGMLRGQHQRVEPSLVTFSEPTTSFPLYQHNGSELLYMLEGEMEYGYGTQRYGLSPGDTLQFIGEVSHGATELKALPIRFLSIKSYGIVRDPRPVGRLPDD